MSKDENIAVKGCSELVLGVFLGLVACMVISLCSCKSGKEIVTERVEVPVVVTEEHHTESIKVDIVRDTIRQRDSVLYYIKGDTTMIERWHYVQGTTQIVYRDTSKMRDSVPYPVLTEKVVTETKEVNRLNWWQKALNIIGGACLIAVGLYIAMMIGKRKVK